MMVKRIIATALCAACVCLLAAAQERDGTSQDTAAESATTEPSPSASSGDYKFDEAEIKKKPYHIGGFAEFRPTLDGLRPDSAFYKLNFYDQKVGGTVQGYNSRAQLDASLEKGVVRLFTRGNLSFNHGYQGWSNDSKLYEGYVTVKPSDGWAIDLGKKAFKWGKGYAWNPVAFIDRPKDPSDPDLALEGFWTASAQYVRSFRGHLKTFSFTSVLLPVFYKVSGDSGINDSFAGSQMTAPGTSVGGTSNQINMAAKAYFLLYNTDIDLSVFVGQTKTTRYGIDVSRNIRTNVEVHGELATISGFLKKYVDGTGVAHTSTYDAVSYLLGSRYLSSKLTTYIFEYYRNGTGYTTEQMQDSFSYVDNAYNTYVTTGNASAIQKASSLLAGNGARNSPLQDYLYVRISQDQPFGILYFTPAMSSIVNVDDASVQLVPELICTRFTNWEIRARTYVPLGGKHTDFGEKQNAYRVELRIRRFF
jgi:hypothetical protein